MLRIYDSKGKEGLRRNSLCIDEEKLLRADSAAQFFAMYVDTEVYESPFRICNEMIEGFKNEVERCGSLELAYSYEDLLKNEADGKISAFIAVEEGGVLEGTMGKFYSLYDRGVRAITLTWNYPNEIGFPNRGWIHQNKGLTPFGRDLVGEMERLGVIPDVSHLSDGGFYDLVKLCKKPFVATHSNCRALCDHPRNLSDEMIRLMAEKGGISGLNYESFFLKKQSARGEALFDGLAISEELGQESMAEELRRETKLAALEDIVRHALHMVKVGGEEFPAIGGDLDGTHSPAGLKDIGEMEKLTEALHRGGLGWSTIEKILHKNARRVLQETLKKRG